MRTAVGRPTYADAYRLLEQSTFGPTPELVAHVQDVGLDAFVDEQFGSSTTNYPDLPQTVPANATDCTGSCVRDRYTMYPLQVEFFRNALTAPDQLRHRVFFALNQIFVTSAVDANLRLPSRMTQYLRLLVDNALGNFRGLLRAVTLSPAMGRYLDMVGNNRTNPNENYARELLQLFSIGVNELADDGTPVLDRTGAPVPTYNQDVVVAFSRVFTGWNFGASPGTGLTNYRDPMVLTQSQHDVAAKKLLNGVTLAANRNGNDDLESALDNIFNHRNVGPFIGRQLIQKLVTSNPTPDYVRRVAAAFNDNGQGVRGDMRATVRAVLLDPEAREPNHGPRFGKLREPVLAITGLLRAFGTTEETTDFVLADSWLPSSLRLGQDLFRAASVFNFYPPGNPVSGSNDLLGPEFALQSTATAFARINLVAAIVYRTMATSTDRPKGTWLDLSELERAAGDPAALVALVDQRLLHGTMPEAMRTVLVDRVRSVAASDARGRARRTVHLAASSSAYQVQR